MKSGVRYMGEEQSREENSGQMDIDETDDNVVIVDETDDNVVIVDENQEEELMDGIDSDDDDDNNDDDTDKTWDSLSEEEKDKLASDAFNIGKIIKKHLFDDTTKILQTYKTNQETPREWLKQRNPVLIRFLEGCTGVSVDNENNGKKILAMTSSVESTLYTRNLNLVSPFAFSRNIFQLSQTKNKTVTQITGAWLPSGGYTTVHGCLTEPVEPVTCPEGTVDYAHDNAQKVRCSSGQIREDSVVPVYICTSSTYIKAHESVSPIPDLHKKEDLKPGKWLKEPNTEIIEEVNNLEEQYMDKFRDIRVEFITEKLSKVKNEAVGNNNGEQFDYIDIAVKHRGQFNVCSKCCHVYVKSYDTCPSCHHNPRHQELGADPYHCVPVHNHPQEPPVIKTGEPCMVNPSSKKNVQVALQHMKETCDIPASRDWMTVWSDAVPYLHTCHLQENLYVCTICHEVLDVTG